MTTMTPEAKRMADEMQALQSVQAGALVGNEPTCVGDEGVAVAFPPALTDDESTALVAFRAAATRMKAADVELRAAQQEYASAIKQLSEAATK